MYKIVKFILRIFLFFVFRIEVRGRENILMTGGAMLASNHKSNWDPLIVALACPRKMRFMSKAELFKFKPFGKLITHLGAFPINRGKGDIGAVKGALTILKNEELMLIFPEGRRIKDEALSEAKPGAVMISIRAKTPIIPVYISGKYRWLSKLIVTFGEPIYYDEYYEEKPVVEKLQSLSNDLLKTMRSYKACKK